MTPKVLKTLAKPSCWLLGTLAVLLAQGQDTIGVRPSRVVGLNYPRLASLAKIEGKVRLLVEIAGDGNVREVHVLAGHALLGDAAKKSLSKWKFAECRETETEPCRLRFVYSFVLEGECSDSTCESEFIVDLPNAVQVKSKTARAIVD